MVSYDDGTNEAKGGGVGQDQAGRNPIDWSVSLSGGQDRTGKKKKKEWRALTTQASHHRCLRSALYMAKPSTANTVAPTLARSQNVEFFRSACAMCLVKTAPGEDEKAFI